MKNKIVLAILLGIVFLVVIGIKITNKPSEPIGVAQAVAPTAEPTPLPTEKPTAEPTPMPTEAPTPEPTVEPTPAPTPEPTPEVQEEAPKAEEPALSTEPTPAPQAPTTNNGVTPEGQALLEQILADGGTMIEDVPVVDQQPTSMGHTGLVWE